MRVSPVAALSLLSVVTVSWAAPGAPSGLQVQRWEGMTLHLAATLRDTQKLAVVHFLCRTSSRCVSTAAFRRLERLMTVTFTMSVGEALPEGWPVERRSLFVLVDLDCRAFANATVKDQDVVLLVSSRRHEEFLSHGGEAFETCWQADLLNVLAVQRRDRGGELSALSGAVLYYDSAPQAARLTASDTPLPLHTDRCASSAAGLRLYTYWPYYPGHCHDIRPHLAALWTPSSPHRAAAFGLAPKDRDLGACPLRVTTFKARPWVEVLPVNGTPGRITLVTGTMKPFILTLAHHLNFTPEFYLPSDGKIFGSSATSLKTEGVLGDLYFNRSDLVLMYTGADLTLPHHARPPTAQVMCTTWCMPTGYNSRSPWRLIVGEFGTETWSAVFISYVLATLSYRFLLPGRTLRDTWLTAVQGLISAIQPIPDNVSPRVFIFCWSFFGLVVATLYMAALHRMITTDTDDTVFHTLSELASSDIPKFASAEHVRAYKKAQFDTKSERLMWARTSTFNYDQSLLMFSRFFARRNICILMDRNQCISYAALFTPPRTAPVFHLLRKYCLAVSQAYNMILRQTSPLLRAFTRATARLDEAGITQHWFDFKEKRFTPSLDPVMRMPHLTPFLKMLGIGCSLGLAMFVLEMVWYSCTKCGARLAHGQRWERALASSDEPGSPGGKLGGGRGVRQPPHQPRHARDEALLHHDEEGYYSPGFPPPPYYTSYPPGEHLPRAYHRKGYAPGIDTVY
ncbi:putative glutamate receptor [Frankliniella fusca]|uniref:Glutamate receptor n=1 Tax=Frankliniella fusca TaxID=407009 RepID=A0AAE1H5F3_9NEOP|nr:putative glutamate receptor [Frankliniella fusca]